jgi:predicted glutamine amidotransferase
MCRLFAMTTGGPRVRAAFWLLEAPASLAKQSRRIPDGTGLGWFGLGDEPVCDRAPIAALDNADFVEEAKFVRSHTFMAHIRYASTGGLTVHNTHPFDINDRLFAHNGLVKEVDTVDSWLSAVDKAFIEGDTDSEHIFAYIIAEIRRVDNTTEGIVTAVDRISREIPLYSLNFLLAEPGKIWALRYPETNPLWVLTAESGGTSGPRSLVSKLEQSHMELNINGDGSVPAVLVASERLDNDPNWRLLAPGELLIVHGLTTQSIFPFDPPKHQLHSEDLNLVEATSQSPLHTVPA